MSNTEIALLGYVSWFLVLLLTIEVCRTYVVIKTGRAANAFIPDGSDVSPFMNRLSRAHANCYESFPFIGGILLYAIASSTSEVTNSLALWLIGARLVQSVVHLFSSSPTFAQIRFLFFIVQIIVSVDWVFRYTVGA